MKKPNLRIKLKIVSVASISLLLLTGCEPVEFFMGSSVAKGPDEKGEFIRIAGIDEGIRATIEFENREEKTADTRAVKEKKDPLEEELEKIGNSDVIIKDGEDKKTNNNNKNNTNTKTNTDTNTKTNTDTNTKTNTEQSELAQWLDNNGLTTSSQEDEANTEEENINTPDQQTQTEQNQEQETQQNTQQEPQQESQQQPQQQTSEPEPPTQPESAGENNQNDPGAGETTTEQPASEEQPTQQEETPGGDNDSNSGETGGNE